MRENEIILNRLDYFAELLGVSALDKIFSLKLFISADLTVCAVLFLYCISTILEKHGVFLGSHNFNGFIEG